MWYHQNLDRRNKREAVLQMHQVYWHQCQSAEIGSRPIEVRSSVSTHNYGQISSKQMHQCSSLN